MRQKRGLKSPSPVRDALCMPRRWKPACAAGSCVTARMARRAPWTGKSRICARRVAPPRRTISASAAATGDWTRSLWPDAIAEDSPSEPFSPKQRVFRGAHSSDETISSRRQGREDCACGRGRKARGLPRVAHDVSNASDTQRRDAARGHGIDAPQRHETDDQNLHGCGVAAHDGDAVRKPCPPSSKLAREATHSRTHRRAHPV